MMFPLQRHRLLPVLWDGLLAVLAPVAMLVWLVALLLQSADYRVLMLVLLLLGAAVAV